MADALYLYAITRQASSTELADTAGLDGAPLAVVDHRGLAAVVSPVSLTEYDEAGLRRNLEDLTWLEEVARGHDAVVKAVAALGPTAPLRLATICLDERGVRERLDESHEALERALDRVTGRGEWSAKAFAAPEQVAPAAGAPAPADGSGAGAAYLQRKKAQSVRRQSSEEAALELAEAVHTALASLSAASRRLRPQDPRLTGHEGTMTLNGAYLVDDALGAAFAAEADRLARQHPDARIEVHGPWPPYSFATLEDG